MYLKNNNLSVECNSRIRRNIPCQIIYDITLIVLLRLSDALLCLFIIACRHVEIYLLYFFCTLKVSVRKPYSLQFLQTKQGLIFVWHTIFKVHIIPIINPFSLFLIIRMFTQFMNIPADRPSKVTIPIVFCSCS